MSELCCQIFCKKTKKPKKTPTNFQLDLSDALFRFAMAALYNSRPEDSVSVPQQGLTSCDSRFLVTICLNVFVSGAMLHWRRSNMQCSLLGSEIQKYTSLYFQSSLVSVRKHHQIGFELRFHFLEEV